MACMALLWLVGLNICWLGLPRFALNCGLVWPVGFSTVLQTPLTASLPNSPVVRAVQGDCERVYGQRRWESRSETPRGHQGPAMTCWHAVRLIFGRTSGREEFLSQHSHAAILFRTWWRSRRMCECLMDLQWKFSALNDIWSNKLLITSYVVYINVLYSV